MDISDFLRIIGAVLVVALIVYASKADARGSKKACIKMEELKCKFENAKELSKHSLLQKNFTGDIEILEKQLSTIAELRNANWPQVYRMLERVEQELVKLVDSMNLQITLQQKNQLAHTAEQKLEQAAM